jgi:hypothetical protein
LSISFIHTTSTHLIIKDNISILLCFSKILQSHFIPQTHLIHTITQHSIAMAQTMLLMSSVSSTYSVELKKDPLLQLQCQRLRSRISNVSFNPLSSNSKCLSSRTFTTLALFKSKTKAPAKVVYIYSFSIFIFLISNKQFLYNLKLI